MRGSKYDHDSTRVTLEIVPVTWGCAPAVPEKQNTKDTKGTKNTFLNATVCLAAQAFRKNSVVPFVSFELMAAVSLSSYQPRSSRLTSSQLTTFHHAPR